MKAKQREKCKFCNLYRYFDIASIYMSIFSSIFCHIWEILGKKAIKLNQNVFENFSKNFSQNILDFMPIFFDALTILEGYGNFFKHMVLGLSITLN